MRDRTSRALKQAASIFLLVATLSIGLLPTQVVDYPRAFLMDIVAVPSAPLHFLSTRLASGLDLGLSSGPSRQDLENEIAKLNAELIYKESQLARARQELESIQNFAAVWRPDIFFVWSGELVGRIDGEGTDVFSRAYIVSLGSNDGVTSGLPVIWGRVALGRITDANILSSHVRILADPKSRVCVRFIRSGWEGVLAGSGKQTCPVRFVPNRVPDEDIKVGDWVVTSGTDGIFPPDLVVGRVTRFAKRPSEPEADVEVELYMDFSRLDNCLVLKRNDGI